MLVIARTVSQQVRYLIFDEPTTSLSLGEIERLFEVIRTLKAQGVGIVYISHRLPEVAAIADDVAVLRNGRKITQFPVSEFSVERVSEAMMGKAVTELYPPKVARPTGAEILRVVDLCKRGKLDNVSLTARRGEILGIAGLVGAGKTELLRAIFGADEVDSGQLELDGQPVQLNNPEQAVRHGIFLVPEERRAQGILVNENVRKNLSLPFLGQFTWTLSLIHHLRELEFAQTSIARVGLTPPTPEIEVRNLSGGNQQKVVIGKWFGGEARVMMFDEATQGIDVKAKRDVYNLVQALAENAAVIYASSDIDEVVGIANRVLVMRDGQVVAELDGNTLDRSLILEYATGARAPMLRKVS